MNWTYEGKEVMSVPKEAQAFVYYLEFTSGHYYYGKKNIYSVRRKKVTGKTRRVTTVTESNWKIYNSSSDEVKARLKSGEKLVKREIVKWCDTVGMASYWEAYFQFTSHVLHDIMALNKWISVRLYKQKIKEDKV